MFKNNIIDLNSRLKQKDVEDKVKTNSFDQAAVVDITERREAMIKEERRRVKRTILTGFIGAYVVIPAKSERLGGLLKVDIHDISEHGVSFDMESAHGQFKVGEEIAMRVYLSQDTYFAFIVTVQNVRQTADGLSARHGANFSKETVNTEALYHFVKFIETVSASLIKDTGDVMVSGLKK